MKIRRILDSLFHLVDDLNMRFYFPGLLRVLLAFELVIEVLRHDCALLATFFQKFRVTFLSELLRHFN